MIPSIELNNGTSIPQLGFGTWRVSAQEATDVVGRALQVGYRHIDTAQGYKNEAAIGEAIAASGLERSELFITSKLDNDNHLPADVHSSFEQTLVDLRTDYVDLFLIHWPLPGRYDGDFVSTWRAMIELAESGRARAIGVSNFEPEHLQRIVSATGVAPAVNQIEVHPFLRNEAARAASHALGTVVEAWGPLAQGGVIGDPVVGAVAAKHGRTDAQVALRWHLQRGDVVFPKSTGTERMRENLDVFGFELDAEDMAALDGLDRGEAGRLGSHPNDKN